MPIYVFESLSDGTRLELFRKLADATQPPPAGYKRVYTVLGHTGANNRLKESLVEKNMEMYKSYEIRKGRGELDRRGLTQEVAKRASFRAAEARMKREQKEINNKAA